MFGVIWIATAGIWPSWRNWLLGLAGYVVALVGFHAFVVFNPSWPGVADLEHWLRWTAREASYLATAAAVSALIVWARTRKAS